MIIGLLLRRHVLEFFAGPSSIHIGKSLSPLFEVVRHSAHADRP